jgi:hypothetical protein
MAAVCGATSAINRRSLDAGGTALLAQASAPLPHGSLFELEESLFVQNPHGKGLKGGIHVLWIPQPIQKHCLGKTAEQCSAIDYCIRTTNKNVSMCQNSSVDVRHLPTYPPGMRPRRVLSVIYFPLAATKGFDTLQSFFDSAPKDTLDRLSERARIKARIKLIRSSDDDQFELLEVLAAPSF